MTSASRLRRGYSLAAASPRDAWLLSRMLAWRAALPLLKRRVPLAKLVRMMSREPGAGIWADPADRVPDSLGGCTGRPSKRIRASASSEAFLPTVFYREPVPTQRWWLGFARGPAR